jgi:pimeloyl-ACP methyl ester carboxylesterase
MNVFSFLDTPEYGGYGWAKYGVPVTYIGCKRDVAIPVSMQEEMVRMLEGNGINVKAVWLDCDHSPYLSKADEVVEVVEEALAEQ